MGGYSHCGNQPGMLHDCSSALNEGKAINFNEISFTVECINEKPNNTDTTTKNVKETHMILFSLAFGNGGVMKMVC